MLTKVNLRINMLVSVDAKTCSKCQIEKPTSEFYDNKYQCKECHYSYAKNPAKRKEYSARHYQKRKSENPQLFMWKQAKHRAKYDYNDMEFTIEVSDIVIPDLCPYFNRPFLPLDSRWGYSLDRIDSSRGYVKDNIRVISRFANVMKNNATEEELISFAEGVLRIHAKGG
jgi:hypothetical protein